MGEHGNGSAWTRYSVDAAFNGVESVHAADVDEDGDLDILGAANIAGEISWWENTAGEGCVTGAANARKGYCRCGQQPARTGSI